MRRLSVVILCLAATFVGAVAQNGDPKSFAPFERDQLMKCFYDMLTVVKRHKLRNQLISFLEAGCASEVNSYNKALRDHWPKEARESQTEKYFQTKTDTNSIYLKSLMFRMMCQNDCMEYPTSAAVLLIAAMESVAHDMYRKQSVSFCTGEACAFDAYRRCLLQAVPDELSKRTKPADFEKVVQTKCGEAESSTRVALTIDFTTAQQLQIDSELSSRSRDLINEAIREAQKEAVVTYAEDLTKIMPERKSCKTPMCGDQRCINLEGDVEYNCSISN